jgi:hypothetical protein
MGAAFLKQFKSNPYLVSRLIEYALESSIANEPEEFEPFENDMLCCVGDELLRAAWEFFPMDSAPKDERILLKFRLSEDSEDDPPIVDTACWSDVKNNWIVNQLSQKPYEVKRPIGWLPIFNEFY